MFDLSGKVAVITGSTRGIGYAIAEQMVRAGAKVVVSSRKEAACVEATKILNEIRGGSAIACPASISSKPELENLIHTAEAKFGGLDILVCNAASNPFYGALLDTTDDAFKKTFENNIISNVWLARLALPIMRRRGGGRIIIMSSVGGLSGSSLLGAYTISKAADYQLARNLAAALGCFNITVNCISPGLIKTDFSKALWENEDILSKVTATAPLQRIGMPEEIAGAAVFLASEAGSFVTGHNLIIDGGASAATDIVG